MAKFLIKSKNDEKTNEFLTIAKSLIKSRNAKDEEIIKFPNMTKFA